MAVLDISKFNARQNTRPEVYFFPPQTYKDTSGVPAAWSYNHGTYKEGDTVRDGLVSGTIYKSYVCKKEHVATNAKQPSKENDISEQYWTSNGQVDTTGVTRSYGTMGGCKYIQHEYISLIWTERDRDTGDFQLKFSYDPGGINPEQIPYNFYTMSTTSVSPGWFVMIGLDLSSTIMIIDKMYLECDEEQKCTCTITGNSIEQMLDWRQISYGYATQYDPQGTDGIYRRKSRVNGYHPESPQAIPFKRYISRKAWRSNTAYAVGDCVRLATATENDVEKHYTCKTAHTSGSTFDESKWEDIYDTRFTYNMQLLTHIWNVFCLCFKSDRDNWGANTSSESEDAKFYEYHYANKKWTANTAYAAGDIAVPVSGTYAYKTFQCSTAHTSGSTFDVSKWTEIASSYAALKCIKSRRRKLDGMVYARNQDVNSDSDLATRRAFEQDIIYCREFMRDPAWDSWKDWVDNGQHSRETLWDPWSRYNRDHHVDSSAGSTSHWSRAMADNYYVFPGNYDFPSSLAWSMTSNKYRSCYDPDAESRFKLWMPSYSACKDSGLYRTLPLYLSSAGFINNSFDNDSVNDRAYYCPYGTEGKETLRMATNVTISDVSGKSFLDWLKTLSQTYDFKFRIYPDPFQISIDPIINKYALMSNRYTDQSNGCDAFFLELMPARDRTIKQVVGNWKKDGATTREWVNPVVFSMENGTLKNAKWSYDLGKWRNSFIVHGEVPSVSEYKKYSSFPDTGDEDTFYRIKSTEYSPTYNDTVLYKWCDYEDNGKDPETGSIVTNWAVGVAYSVGDIRKYRTQSTDPYTIYKCIKAHTSEAETSGSTTKSYSNTNYWKTITGHYYRYVTDGLAADPTKNGYIQTINRRNVGDSGYKNGDRREHTVDESNSKRNDYSSADDYRTYLRSQGYNTMCDESVNGTYAVEAELNTSNPIFVYGKDYELGDYVTVSTPFNLVKKARVSEFIRSWDTAGYKEYPTFVYKEDSEEFIY